MPTVSYEDFKEAWIEDVLSGNPTNVEKGRRFAEKIIKDWRGFPDSTEITYCDGTGDGGIDVAILDRPDEDEGETSGDTWYLIQSKYGTAWRGNTTAVEEALKLFDTLEGEGRVQQSLITEEIVEKVRNFLRQAGEDDRLVLVFATVNPPTPGEKKRLNDIRDFGKSRFDVSFDVVSISVRTIYERLQDEIARDVTERLTIPIKGHLTYGGLDLLIGVVSLLDLYRFLKVYRERTQDLDQLYERNVRRYLGGVKVNKAIQSTLRESPEKFGLYNNGITIVVSDFQANGDEYNLIEPYIVNGCQTTRSIWEVMNRKLDSGGTGQDPDIQAWKLRAESGIVVTKVVKVGQYGEILLHDITRYTNSQNAVREQDFIGLDKKFRQWQESMERERSFYLEIQRGGWTSRKARQRQNPAIPRLSEYANARDLLKVYGSGWEREPGTAFGKNPPFLPNGAIFRRIMDRGSVEDSVDFGSDDLYAAYLLQTAGTEFGFGRRGTAISRRQTKYLFYFVAIDLLKDVLRRNQVTILPSSLTGALLNVLTNDNARLKLLQNAVEVVDGYLLQGGEDTVFEEPNYNEKFGHDLNRYLKWDHLGRDLDQTPKLKIRLSDQKRFMGRVTTGALSDRKTIISAIGLVIPHRPETTSPPDPTPRPPLPHEQMQFSPENPPRLEFTRIISAKFGSEQRIIYWSNLLHAALRAASQHGLSLNDIDHLGAVQLRQGEHTDTGFSPVQGTNYSVQGMDSNRSFSTSYAIAQRIGVDLNVEFQWRNRADAAHPGCLGSLHN